MSGFDKFGARQYGDPESKTTVVVWVWMEASSRWIPKSPDRHFPTAESLVALAESFGTVAQVGETGGPVPRMRPSGVFLGLDRRIGVPWNPQSLEKY